MRPNSYEEHVEKCLTCGKLLVAYERYLQCPKKERRRGFGRHGPVLKVMEKENE